MDTTGQRQQLNVANDLLPNLAVPPTTQPNNLNDVFTGTDNSVRTRNGNGEIEITGTGNLNTGAQVNQLPTFDQTKSYVSRMQGHGNIPPPYMLTDENRMPWEMHFRAFFSYNKMSVFINNNAPIPDVNDPSRATWDEDNETVKSIMLASVPTELAHRFKLTPFARDVWCQILTEKNSLTVQCAAAFRKIHRASFSTSGAQYMKVAQNVVNEIRSRAPDCPDSVLLGMVLGSLPSGNSDVENLFSTLADPPLAEGMRQLTAWMKNRSIVSTTTSLSMPPPVLLM